MKALLKNKAFKMFNQWVTNAKIDYPHLNYQIKELSNLENNLEKIVYEAVFTLEQEEKLEKRKIEGYDYGFICGFIIGSLNVKWNYEYIYKQSNQYKMFEVLVILSSYLKFDDLKKIQLKSLYEEHYASEINIDNPNTEIPILIPKDIDFLEMENEPNPILATLENLKLEMISNNNRKKSVHYLKSVYEYLSEEEVLEILRIGKEEAKASVSKM